MINVGVIGAGKMGLSHIAILNQTPGVSLYAIAEPSQLLRKGLERNFGFKTFRTAEKLLADDKLDAVLIAAPNKMHFSLAKQALERGLHCFIEKPLTTNPADSQILSRYAEEHNCYVQVGYVNRFNPVFQKVQSLLQSGVIGEISAYTSVMEGAVVIEEGNSGWRSSYKAGGGCLNDYGPHCIDLGFYLCGSDVTLQTAELSKVYSSQVDDKADFEVKHANGVKGRFQINWSVPELRKATNTVEITGSLATLRANKQEIVITPNNGTPSEKIYVTDLNTDTDYYLRGEDFSRQLLEFSERIRGIEKTTHSNLRDAVRVDLLINAVFTLAGVKTDG